MSFNPCVDKYEVCPTNRKSCKVQMWKLGAISECLECRDLGRCAKTNLEELFIIIQKADAKYESALIMVDETKQVLQEKSALINRLKGNIETLKLELGNVLMHQTEKKIRRPNWNQSFQFVGKEF